MSNYNWAFNFIKEDIKTAFEIGSRDLLDAHTIQSHYNCKVYSFECNPDCIEECKKNYKDKDNIVLVEKAVSQKDDFITFRPFNLNKYNNMGASSMFEIDFSTRNHNDTDYGKVDIQDIIKVPSIRIDTFCKENNLVPDVIFMDVQESELEVLKSASSYLKKIKYIVTEASTKSTYKGGCDIVDINDFLVSEGFELISHPTSIINRTDYFSSLDIVYKRFKD